MSAERNISARQKTSKTALLVSLPPRAETIQTLFSISSLEAPKRKHFIFGSAKADFIEGAGRQDHLYGGAGGDVLIGGKADDYLEGGTGFDTYQFRSGDGRDTVLDADGKGILIRDSKAILLAIKQTDSQWSFGSTNFSLAASGSDLDITFAGAGDVLTLKDFDFAKG